MNGELLDADAELVGVGVVAQFAAVKVSLSKVTAPLRASARPCTSAPVCTAIDVNAMIVPLNEDVVPSVAELPTCQNTWQAWAPLMTLTWLAEAVISVEATWNETASGLP